MSEMRGNVPENFFAWILRYPERDAVIITLRNVYGSTEGLEQNIQAILFDAEPRLPSRSLKDFAAQLWLFPARWASSHIIATLILAPVLVGGLWWFSRRKRQAHQASQTF